MVHFRMNAHTYCNIQCENLVTYLDFEILQGSVATYCRWDGNLCGVYREFSYESIAESILKSVHICQSYYQTSSGLIFWDTV